jgi:hypothetical protein
MRALQLHEALGYSQYWNSPTSTISILAAEVPFVHKLNYFFRFRELEDSYENELTRGLLAVMRLSPAAHFAFLDMVRERQSCKAVPAIMPSVLLGNEVDIRTQEGMIDRESGQLISVVLTREPWTTAVPVTSTDDVRVYDGVLYYGDEWIIILENKPKDEVPPIADLEREMKPNLPLDSAIEICDRVVNIVWRDLLARFDGLTHSGMIHGAELAVMRDFRALIHRRFPYLNPYSSIAACGGTSEALGERCAAIMEQITPDRFDGKNALQFSPAESHVGMIYLRPDPLDQREDGRRVESICLEMFPAMTVPQAQKFYREVLPTRFASADGLIGKGWTVRPWLTFRFQGTIKYQPNALIDADRSFSFWQAHPEMIRGNVDREVVAAEWWDAWVAAGLVQRDDCQQILARFSERQRVNICPGFRLRYSWPLPEVERLDSLRTPPGSQQTAFISAVRDKIRQAFQAIGQDFDGLVK